MPDIYVELLNFQLEMMNKLEIREYELNHEERIPVIKNWLDQEGLLLKESYTRGKRKMQNHKGLF